MFGLLCAVEVHIYCAFYVSGSNCQPSSKSMAMTFDFMIQNLYIYSLQKINWSVEPIIKSDKPVQFNFPGRIFDYIILINIFASRKKCKAGNLHKSLSTLVCFFNELICLMSADEWPTLWNRNFEVKFLKSSLNLADFEDKARSLCI